jgi:signal transduction histidine kinase
MRARLRAFLAELARLRDPRTLLLGVVSGYALTACFAVLVALAIATGVLRWHWAFGALLGAKLATNTAAYIALRKDRAALELGGLNVAMDAVVMTGAIWATGDTASPLVAIYTIEVTVLALLTNLACTVAIGALSLVLYVVMGVLVTNGVIESFPTPAEWGGHTNSYLVLASLFAAFVIGAPTFYTAGILKQLRENERRLERQSQALIDAGKQKAQFMANITHELRTPLHGIMGLGTLVAKGIYGDTTARQRDAMRELELSAKRLLALIDDLLLLASHDAGKLELQPGRVEVRELLASVFATSQWLLANKQLTIDIEVPPELPAIVTDRRKVTQIVLNLMSNAIKFTPDGGTVALRARVVDEQLRIEVADTGVGIPPNELERVFDEFHQVDGSSVREFGGVGIGLALVRRLTGLLGGTVTVTSEVGTGSTFVVLLPLAPPAT